MPNYKFVLDFDTIEELYSGEVKAKNAEQAKAKVLDMLSVAVVEATND